METGRSPLFLMIAERAGKAIRNPPRGCHAFPRNLRAAIAEMMPANRRASAYGIFNAGFGLFWFLASALMGVLYDYSIPALIAFLVTAQLAAIPLFMLVKKTPAQTSM
jgi:MFS family permease